MYRTAENVCTGEEERKESRNLARKIAISNGYEVEATRVRGKRWVVSQNNISDEKSGFTDEIDTYASLLEDDATSSSPPVSVRPIPLGIKAKSDGDVPPEEWPEDDPYDQVIRQSVAAICSSVGFDAIDANMLEVLAQRLKNCSQLEASKEELLANLDICSISLGAKLNCEVAGRNILIASDVWLALADLGHKVDQLPGYLSHLRVTGTIAIAPPRERQEPPAIPPMLIGQSRPHPPYVHEFFPAFPEPHTYIHTEISGEPDLTYEAVRKTAAQRKREMERSLINYMMCMHAHTTLFPQFEMRVRNEAKQYLRDVERDRDFRKKQKEAVKAGLVKKEVCDGEEDSGSDRDETASEEDLEDVAETEMNMILQRIPPSCAVISPMPELRPYMSCLRSDEMKERGVYDDDDEEDTFTIADPSLTVFLTIMKFRYLENTRLQDIDKKENGNLSTLPRTENSAANGGDESESHGQMYDNLYLRIAQTQRKKLKFLRENLEVPS
ncbi:unnamed protein product [Angiostrongylus costaricensis]|uniref:Transcription initiation factor TFIID subunit 8 n=1 Tax=Angiostrongylus costaricensis TaxID=334426 RepID=A0A158PL56_ANGCS|nr:unnamed protein product [Angiostrongylus costaricensis]